MQVTSARCFKIDTKDNVATLLDDAVMGEAQLIGAARGAAEVVILTQAVQLGHKVALSDIRAGEPVLKFGVTIGKATQAIHRGDWVHLHNCQSHFDARSGSLDLHSGSTTDMKYE